MSIHNWELINAVVLILGMLLLTFIIMYGCYRAGGGL